MKTLIYLVLIFLFFIDRYFKDFAKIPKSINYNLAFNITFHWYFLGVLILCLIFGFWFFNFKSVLLSNKLAFTAIFLGALSNLLDRVLYGGVVDYINFLDLFRNNISDILISGGMIYWVFRANR